LPCYAPSAAEIDFTRLAIDKFEGLHFLTTAEIETALLGCFSSLFGVFPFSGLHFAKTQRIGVKLGIIFKIVLGQSGF